MIYILPALILSLIAQSKVKSAYAKYSKVRASSNLTGADIARRILVNANINDVSIGRVSGELTDHYDPRKKEINLSNNIHSGNTIAAYGIAAHEAGHVLQHYEGYGPIKLRNSIVPVIQFSSSAAIPLFFLGFLFNAGTFMTLGIVLFSGVVVFHLVTLPVEFNASKRAINVLQNDGYLSQTEISGVKEVLNAAALTYVASAVMAAMQLLRLLAMSRRR
ncbi:MAG: zinc metallopeptidase [Clostridia bacterium]